LLEIRKKVEINDARKEVRELKNEMSFCTAL
jgi:hypothetical protein